MGRIFARTATGRGTAALVLALGLAAALAAAPDARAQDGKFYVGLNVPVMFIDDTDSTTTGSQSGLNPMAPTMPAPYTAKSTSEYDTGFKVAGVVGYGFGGGLRVEGELFFARAEVSKVTYTSVSAGGNPVPGIGNVDVPIDGTADQLGGFASVWYDIETGTDWIPYIGGGLGFIRVDQGNLDYDSNALFRAILAASPQPPPPGVPLNDVPEISTTDTVLAYHFGAGVGYRLNDNVTLQAGYRFQTANDLEFDAKNAAGTVKVASGLRVHFLEIGVRYRF